MHEFTAVVVVKPDTKPRFCRTRSVPHALKEPIERELDRLESEGVIEPVSHSDWAVAVPKLDGTVRLCGDYKVTVNPSIDIDQYLSGGQKFTKLDLSSAYQQMPLEEESRPLVTINTHRGLYRFIRLPFGIASALAIFQKAMDVILQGLPQVICYLDDILVTGDSNQEHLQNLEEVLRRLHRNGVRLKKRKCAFMQSSVDYLGHRIDSQGIHPDTRKVEAIQNAPQPTKVSELRSVLGMINYYGKFVPNLAWLLHPMYELLKANQRWVWSKECEEAFSQAKNHLVEAPVLVHYDPKYPIRVAGDASNYRIGAVLSHTYPDGSEHPIAFASRTLSSQERNYPQVEREALSLNFGIRKFHKYVYGRKFTVITDHRPLTAILVQKQESQHWQPQDCNNGHY